MRVARGALSLELPGLGMGMYVAVACGELALALLPRRFRLCLFWRRGQLFAWMGVGFRPRPNLWFSLMGRMRPEVKTKDKRGHGGEGGF